MSTKPEWAQPIYEIPIGGWSNTASVIRLIGREQDLVTASTPGIVNANEMRGFWIRWSNNIIHVGRMGETVSFMSYKDANLFTIKYVGICTAYGSRGIWLINGKNPIRHLICLICEKLFFFVRNTFTYFVCSRKTQKFTR